MIPTYEESRSAYIDGKATPMQEFIYLHRDAFRDKEWFALFARVIEQERETARQEGHRDCLEVLKKVQNEQYSRQFQLISRLSLPKPNEQYLNKFFVNLKRAYQKLRIIQP